MTQDGHMLVRQAKVEKDSGIYNICWGEKEVGLDLFPIGKVYYESINPPPLPPES